MKENYLHVWGKNFPLPQALRQKVLSAAAGENHILFTTASGDTFGMGSNRFGQLGLKEPQFYQQPVPIFEGHRIASLHCGAEHSFFINDRNEVYSTGLNVKGQLGLYHFQNVYSPTLVVGLLPYGAKNSKAEKSIASKQPKSPIVEVLQRFDLQVKIQDQNQKICILNHDQLIINIACGALFTVALSNVGRVFVSGLIGGGLPGSIEEQTERTRFRVIEIAENIQSIDAGLSGASALTSDGKAFIWGRFGKILLNIPRRIQLQQKDLPSLADDLFCEVKVGDQCAFALTIKGEILSFGQNIDNQLGCEQHILPFKDKFSRVEGSPFAQKIYVGRNTVFAVDAENSEVFGWGSNKYGQIFPGEDPKGLMPITNLKFQLDQHDILIPSSYFTLLLSKRAALSNLFSSIKKDSESSQQTIPLTEYKKLLRDYQILKALNMTLLEKSQTSRKENKQVQTPSKFQISGITQHRKFNSNIEIGWKELQIESQINEGGYGIIYKAKWRQIMVVVKKFKIQNGDVSLRDFLSQCHAMEAVRHPNIVMFLGAVTTNPNYSIILEYCPKGSLWSYLQNRDNNIAWEERRRFSIQIAQGVLYLHSCTPPILHRDLKSLNIFLDGSLRIKIGDFGWTKTLQEYMTNKIGTYQWMAPEVIGNKPYSQKADVFSYSIIMWEIASREPPYRNINGTKVSEEVLNRDLRPTVPNKCPEAYAKLMRRCWDSDPSRRPSFREIVKELEVMKLSSV